MAETYAAHDVQSIFLYTREAHPGENYPCHASFDQKLVHARAFRDRFGIKRPILVDDLAGSVHHQYGLLPNMTWIINQANRVVFKADWTHAPTVEMALNYLLKVRDERRAGGRLAQFYAELLGFRWLDRVGFEQGLQVAGPKASTEFADAEAFWAANPTQTPRRVVD